MSLISRPVVTALLAVLAGFGAAAQQPDSGVTEKVNVVLVEFKLLVTDKDGRPVTDLRTDEVKVLEGGRPQQLAFVESWLTARSDPALEAATSVPGTMYSPSGEQVPPQAQDDVPPPKPVRRVIFIFDARNSRIRIRDEWRKAAKDWVAGKMAAGDQVSVVVLRNHADWVLTGSSAPAQVQQALDAMDLSTDTPNRSRREDMSDLLNDLQASCVDVSGSSGKGGSSGSASTQSLSDEAACAYGIARPYIEQWGNESEESILALRQLTGQLSAMPGRKAVILFSEGIIPAPSETAINAMLSIWGPQIVNFRQLGSTLKRDEYGELSELHRVARASDVVYFTLDSRPNSERGYSNEIENQTAQARGALAENPWGEMYEATRSTLSALAYATGGRPFYGDQELLQSIDVATSGFYGVYNVGYYRSNPMNPGGLKVKISRKGVHYDVPKDVAFHKHEARRTAVELAVGRPAPGPGPEQQQLPVAVMALYDLLPLRRSGGARGCQLGVFVQAQRRDGSVAAESFETAIVAVEPKDLEELKGRYYDHRTALELAPGEYRLRARISDEMNAILGDTYIDLTVGEGTITPGFR